MTIAIPSWRALLRQPGVTAATLDNPVTGDRLTLLQSVPRDGAPLVFRIDLPPGAAGSPLHLHPVMDETFEVVAGELLMEVGGKGQWRTLRSGDRAVVPAGTPHSFRNVSADWTSFVSTTTRGLEFERFLLTMHGLAVEGRATAAGLPRNLLHLALVLHYADLVVPGVPLGLQRGIIGLLVRLARASGVERRLRRHWQNERGGRLA